MLLLPREMKSTIESSGTSSHMLITLKYVLTYDQYRLADGDFYLHIRNKANDCDMVCPTCGGAL